VPKTTNEKAREAGQNYWERLEPVTGQEKNENRAEASTQIHYKNKTGELKVKKNEGGG